jgi:hypothetical protein
MASNTKFISYGEYQKMITHIAHNLDKKMLEDGVKKPCILTVQQNNKNIIIKLMHAQYWLAIQLTLILTHGTINPITHLINSMSMVFDSRYLFTLPNIVNIDNIDNFYSITL